MAISESGLPLANPTMVSDAIKDLARSGLSAHEMLMINRQAINIVANFSGVGARLVFALAFNIVYFRLLGSEGYGLIGFYTSLAGLSLLFDFGLNQTAVLEVARRGTESQEDGADLRPVVFTLQVLLGGLGVLLGLVVALASPWMASWFSAARLSAHEVTASVLLMAAVLALQFPVNFYYGVLTGLQRQVLSNAIIVAATLLRGLLTLALLFAFGSAPSIFFAAQIAASILEMVVVGVVVWRLLPSSPQRPRIDTRLLGATWKFTTGTWLAVTFAQAATLLDKIILSALLPLNLFGLYSLAVTVAVTIQRLAPPFTNASFPHFVKLIEEGRTELLARSYRQVSEAASAIFLAAGPLLAVYAGPVAALVAGDAPTAADLSVVLALLAAANTLNVEMAMPFSLLFAHGITWIALRLNLTLCVAYLAALVLLVPRYGVDAAAGLWLAANAVMLPVLVLMTHRTVLPGQAWPWLYRTILLPGCSAAAVLVAGAAVMPDLSRVPMLIWIGLNGALALVAALLSAPVTREMVLSRLQGRSTAAD